MAYGKKLPKCTKCGHKCLGRCPMCGDPYCFFHLREDASGTPMCSPCVAKYYNIWIQEKEYDHTTELELNEWLKQMVRRDSALG